jgi:hypothetical protein
VTPAMLKETLREIVMSRIPSKKGPKRMTRALMIWGPPGVGKSSIVKQVAAEAGIGFEDVRISQLAPTDLRGIPAIGDGSDPYVANDGKSHWLPPEFLPRKGAGILFLDELNMAPPAVQGIAQQLVLDRKVGDYVVPPDWYIWAAGNRKHDRASVYEMPAPLANRFLHYSIEPDLASWKLFGLANGVPTAMMAFLSRHTTMLHLPSPTEPAWPSPRTWEMAAALERIDLHPAHAVGVGPASEYLNFLGIYHKMAEMDLILQGRGDEVDFPPDDQPDQQYAIAVSIAMLPKTKEEAVNVAAWAAKKMTADFGPRFILDFATRLKGEPKLLSQVFTELQKNHPEFVKLMTEAFRQLTLPKNMPTQPAPPAKK